MGAKKISPLILPKKSRKDFQGNQNIIFSFQHLCRDQGASLEDWQKDEMLAKAIERLYEYSQKLISQTDKEYAIYEAFPENSNFTPPNYAPQDAVWARIHVDGKHVIAGHIVENVFYVVFLDSNHKFWITEKKHT